MKEPDNFYEEKLRNKFDVQANNSQVGQQKLIMKSAYTLNICNHILNNGPQMFSILCEMIQHRCVDLRSNQSQ